VQDGPEAGDAPAPEIAVHRRPGRKIRRQLPPLAAGGNPADTIEGPIREERDPAILLKTEYKALLQVAGDNERDFAIVMLFLQSSLRVSELVNLTLLTLEECSAAEPFDLCITVGNEILPPVQGLGRRNVFICQFPFPLGPGNHVERMRSYWDGYDLVLVYSEYVRHHVLKQAAALQLPSRDVEILHPTTQLFSPHLQEKGARILNVGRFFTGGHCKRQDSLIEAFRELVDGSDSVPSELHLVGSIHPEPEHCDYFVKLQKAACGLPIHFHPNCSPQELAHLYETSCVYWHATGFGADVEAEPHRVEHFGISVVEAMSAGCIPVVYAAGGPTEIVKHGQTGFHFRTLEELCRLTQPLVSAPRSTEVQSMGFAAAEAAKAYSSDVFRAHVRETTDRLLQLQLQSTSGP
jgi:Glycosyl transferases group 1